MEKNSRLTKDQVQERLNELYDGNYSIIGDYINNKTETTFMCNRCGRTYLAKPKRLLELTGGLCPDCDTYNDKYNISYDAFIYRIKRNYGLDVTYRHGFNKNGKNTKTTIITVAVHRDDDLYIEKYPLKDLIWKPKNIISNESRRGKYLLKDNYLESLLIDAGEKDNYTWLDDYKGNNKLLHKIKHIECGNEYEVRPNDFQQGYRCPICAHRYRRSELEDIMVDYIKKKYNYQLFTNSKFTDAYNKSYECDIHILALNVGIEIDGYYWHSFPRITPNRVIDKFTFFIRFNLYLMYFNEIDLTLRTNVVTNWFDHYIASTHEEYSYIGIIMDEIETYWLSNVDSRTKSNIEKTMFEFLYNNELYWNPNIAIGTDYSAVFMYKGETLAYIRYNINYGPENTLIDISLYAEDISKLFTVDSEEPLNAFINRIIIKHRIVGDVSIVIIKEIMTTNVNYYKRLGFKINSVDVRAIPYYVNKINKMRVTNKDYLINREKENSLYREENWLECYDLGYYTFTKTLKGYDTMKSEEEVNESNKND